MLRSSANLAADDVSITCRVRRSEYALNPKFGAAEEMTVTMRYWQPTITPPEQDENLNTWRDVSLPNKQVRDPSPAESVASLSSLASLFGVGDNPVQAGAELVLCSVSHAPIKLSERFESFSSSNSGPSKNSTNGSSNHRNINSSANLRKIWAVENKEPEVLNPPPEPCTIPLSDIVVVDVHGKCTQNDNDDPKGVLGGQDQMNLTTVSHGYYEFFFHTKNARDVLLAFLKASLPPERIADGLESSTADGGDLLALQEGMSTISCCPGESFDAEALTAARMKERVRTETSWEKMRRKMALLSSRIEELSNDLADCACGCNPSEDVSPEKQRWVLDEKRQSPPRRFELPEDLEFSQSHQNLDFLSFEQPSFASPANPKPKNGQSVTSSRTTPKTKTNVAPRDVPKGISFEVEGLSPKDATPTTSSRKPKPQGLPVGISFEYGSPEIETAYV